MNLIQQLGEDLTLISKQKPLNFTTANIFLYEDFLQRKKLNFFIFRQTKVLS